MRYVLYARKSSEEKNKQVQSIDDQVAALQPVIRERGLDVVAVLTESRSAKAPGRPVFNRMLEMIDRGQADAVLCWHLNRLTRNEIDSGTIRWLLRNGAIREIVTPGRVYRPEDNALVTAVESAMGEQFLVELKQSSRRGVLSKIEKGWFPGHVPPGYRNDVLTHTITRDPARWDLVRRAWEEMLAGRTGVPALAARMTSEWGYRGPRAGGAGMARNTLYNVLSNPFYTGVFVFEGRLYPGRHEPMVTHEEFAAVQRLLGRGEPKPNHTRHAFAFSGLIRCGHCGRAVCADRKRKVLKATGGTTGGATGEERFYTYYACSRGGKCNPHRLREEAVEAKVAAWLEGITLPPEYVAFAREVAQRARDEMRRAEEAVRSSQERTLAGTERQIDELIRMRALGLVDDAEFARTRERLKAERLELLERSDRSNRAMERGWEEAVAVAEFCAGAGRRFTVGGVTEKGRVARQLGAAYTLKDGVLLIEEHELLGLVRAHNEKAAAPPRPFEPAESGSGSGEAGGPVRVCEGWGVWRNRTRIKPYEPQSDALPKEALEETRALLETVARLHYESACWAEPEVLEDWPQFRPLAGLYPGLVAAVTLGAPVLRITGKISEPKGDGGPAKFQTAFEP